LFDFPSPSMSSEKRFATNVPLQRLFFMNSDFMQQQAELLARRVANEPDTAARIRKAYSLVLGRGPTDAEMSAGVEYLKREPMQEYEERKLAAAKKEAEAKTSEGKAAKDGKGTAPAATPAVRAKGTGQTPKTDLALADGMMAGVMADATNKPADYKLLPPTTWGRYVKILLSSGEFLYVE
jgi:hypothetical protein